MESVAAASAHATVSALKEKGLRVSSNITQHIDWLQGDIDQGFERIFLYTISGNPERFIDTFGKSVLPQLRGVSRRG